MFKNMILPIGFIFPLLAWGSVDEPTLASLNSIIHKQQAQLAKQNQEIANQQKLLSQLMARVNSIAAPSSSVVSPANSTVTYQTVKPKKQSVLKQATSSESEVSIPRHALILGTKTSHISVAGQASMVAFQADDGTTNRAYYGTNTASNSRFSINSKFKKDDSLSVGSHFELGLKTNPSVSISQTSPNSSVVDIRKAELFVKSTHWGEVLFGKGETSSDNTAYVDFSGTKMAGRSSVGDIGGGLYFNNITSNPQVGTAFNNLDGFSRKVRLRYNTPAYHGVSLSTSAIEGNRNDVVLRYGDKIAGTKVAAEWAYTSPQDISSGANLANGNETNASASVLFPVGISMTGAVGKVIAKNSGRNDPRYFYVKPGFQFHYFNGGLTALSVDYGRYYDFVQNRDVGSSEGAQLLQNFNHLDLAIYGGYRRFDLKRPGGSLDSINVFLLGALYKF